VVLLPRDRTIAALYFRAAEGSRVVRHRIAALEHLASVVPRTPALLGELAELHRQAGDGGRARGALEEASRLLASSRRARRGAAERLAEIAARLDAGAPEPPAVPDDTPPAIRFTPPPPPPEPEPPAEAARLEIPVTLASDIACLDALGDQPGSPADATLALMATGLADAESFDRLLSLERAAGLLRLSHQEETARKVLTVFLGRALLADEVGLGKTIEAGLVLSEYLLRGRVSRALVLAPCRPLSGLPAVWRARRSRASRRGPDRGAAAGALRRRRARPRSAGPHVVDDDSQGRCARERTVGGDECRMTGPRRRDIEGVVGRDVPTERPGILEQQPMRETLDAPAPQIVDRLGGPSLPQPAGEHLTPEHGEHLRIEKLGGGRRGSPEEIAHALAERRQQQVFDCGRRVHDEDQPPSSRSRSARISSSERAAGRPRSTG